MPLTKDSRHPAKLLQHRPFDPREQATAHCPANSVAVVKLPPSSPSAIAGWDQRKAGSL